MTNVSAFQGELPIMIFLTPSLITNAGDQQFIHVAIHENARFSERAAVAQLIYPKCLLAVSRFAHDYNSDLTLAPDATKSLIRF